MADFRSSSHRAKWIFTPQDLVVKRDAANRRAVQMLEKYGVTRLGVDLDGSISYPEPLNDLNADRHSLPKPLNCGEEQLMRWSVMEHHPKHIMLTCIYASCKIEENHVSAEELGKGIQQDHQMILNNEMVVFQSLGFDLIVYAPYRSIEGFGEDIEEFCQRRAAGDNFKILRETAKSEVDRIMLTDAPLLFPPGQLALAGLRRSNEVHRVLEFERYLMNLCSRQHSAHTISELTNSLNAIDLLVGGLGIPTANEMKHVDRKLKMCWDPSPQDEKKKREKRSKHKSKRTANEMQGVPE